MMDKHLKVLYIKVPSIHSPLHYEVFYNTTQVTSELQLMSIPLAKVTFAFSKRYGVCQRSVGLEEEEFLLKYQEKSTSLLFNTEESLCKIGFFL